VVQEGIYGEVYTYQGVPGGCTRRDTHLSTHHGAIVHSSYPPWCPLYTPSMYHLWGERLHYAQRGTTIGREATHCAEGYHHREATHCAEGYHHRKESTMRRGVPPWERTALCAEGYHPKEEGQHSAQRGITLRRRSTILRRGVTTLRRRSTSLRRGLLLS